jgi:glycosyltransferase involved in cell wall biosynthesis
VVSGVSVVVPTYQRAQVLPAVLAPLLADPALRELIVVVDGSSDATMQVLSELSARHPTLRHVWQPNSGAGAARQRGVLEARGDVVLLLDDDVVAAPGLVSGHAAEHERRPGRVVLGSMPPVLPSPRSPGHVTTVLYAKAYEHACAQFRAHPERILEGFWSGNVSMPRDLAVRIGLDDPELTDLFPSEDRELGLRLRAAGVEAVFCPELAATHLHSRTLGRFTDDSRRQGRALQALHARHPEVVGAPTAASIAGRIPPPARWLVTGARRSAAAGGAAQALSRLLVELLGVVRWWRAQDVALVLLQRVAQARGAREADAHA